MDTNGRFAVVDAIKYLQDWSNYGSASLSPDFLQRGVRGVTESKFRKLGVHFRWERDRLRQWNLLVHLLRGQRFEMESEM